MRRDVDSTLASQFSSHEIVRQIHDVPPHEVYEVSVDGWRAVYKGDTGPTGSAAVEGAVMAFLGERTSVPVPDVLAVGDEGFVAAWHPDAPVPGEGEATEAWARAAGRGLASLHDESDPLVDRYGQFLPGDPGTDARDPGTGTDARDPGITVEGHDEWHAAAIDYVRRHRPVLARHGHADVADAVLDCLDAHPSVFEDVDGPVCCHGWATPDHVAVKDGRVACVVDFEHAIAAPGEFDYWRTVLPAFGSDDALRRSFREGYESVRSLPPGLERRKPLYSILNGVYYFESLYVQDQHGPAETAERAGRIRDRVFENLDDIP